MKTKIFALIISFLSVSAYGQRINVETEPAQRFYQLMKYIEDTNNGKIKMRRLPFEQIKIEYEVNRQDTTRQQLIDSLLETRPYSHKYMDYVKAHGEMAKEAYRLAYNVLGKGITMSMTAGMPRTWVRFWNSKKRERINFEDVENSLETIEFDTELMKKYLPQNTLNKDKGITVYFAVDGNRGAYQEDSIMVFDFTDKSLKVDKAMKATLAHELHHIYYGDWLNNHLQNTPIDSSFRAAQMSFIQEGLAQFINFDTYPKRIKKLYSNKKLLRELFDDLCQGKYEINYDTEIKRLKKYIFIPISKEYPYRPSILYYLSYNIYKSIEIAGGVKMLNHVISNPKELITTYNKLYNEDIMLFGPLPNKFESAWRANL